MNFKRSLPGYIATGALVLTTTLWTYWGVAEMYYERANRGSYGRRRQDGDTTSPDPAFRLAASPWSRVRPSLVPRYKTNFGRGPDDKPGKL